jgi:polyphosphate kinase
VGERLRILGLMAAAVDNLFILELPAVRHRADNGDRTAQAMLAELALQVQPIVDQAAAFITEQIFAEMERAGIRVQQASHLMTEQRTWLRDYFQNRVYPLITPLAVDPGRPFPFISTHSLNLLVHLPRTELPQRTVSRWQPQTYARIKVPRMLPRLVQLPPLKGRSIRGWIWSEEVLRFSVAELFQGMEMGSAHVFRVLRSGSQLTSAPALLGPAVATRKIERLSQVMRLDVEASMPQAMVDWLAHHLEVPRYSIFRIPGPLSLVQLVDVANIVDGIPLARSL